MEYIYVNNCDSELYKKENKSAFYYIIYLKINVNRIIHLKKRDIKKLLVIFVFLLLNNEVQ